MSKQKNPQQSTRDLCSDLDLAISDIEAVIALLYLFGNVGDDVIAEIPLPDLGRVGKILVMNMLTVTGGIEELKRRLEHAESRIRRAV